MTANVDLSSAEGRAADAAREPLVSSGRKRFCPNRQGARDITSCVRGVGALCALPVSTRRKDTGRALKSRAAPELLKTLLRLMLAPTACPASDRHVDCWYPILSCSGGGAIDQDRLTAERRMLLCLRQRAARPTPTLWRNRACACPVRRIGGAASISRGPSQAGDERRARSTTSSAARRTPARKTGSASIRVSATGD